MFEDENEVNNFNNDENKENAGAQVPPQMAPVNPQVPPQMNPANPQVPPQINPANPQVPPHINPQVPPVNGFDEGHQRAGIPRGVLYGQIPDRNGFEKPVNGNPMEGVKNRYDSSHIPKEPEKPKKGKGGFFKKVLAFAFLGLMFGLFAGAGIYMVNKITQVIDGDNAPAAAQVSEIPKTEVLPEVEKPVPALDNAPGVSEAGGYGLFDASYVAENTMPSIVAITNKFTSTYESFWGFQQQYQNESSGSGIIVGENETELLVVTNTHVIADADELTVQFADGERYDAHIKGSKSAEDLAIVAVNLSDMKQSTLDSIKIAILGDSDTLRVGEPVIAIGNSLGYGQSVTSGIISALDRDFEYEGGVRKVVQTDAAINPGNSGGALLNIKGEVIGINEAKYSSTAVEGVGYAIPISTAKPIIDDLVTKTTRSKVADQEKGFLGIAGVDITDDVANMYGLPKGVYIKSIEEGSAAATYGLKERDVIFEFDGEDISTMAELQNVLSFYPAGSNVKIKVNRGGENLEIDVTLGKRPQ